MFTKLEFNLIKNRFKYNLNNLLIKRLNRGQSLLINDQVLHRMTVNTCGKIYGNNLSKKWYLRYAPKTGIDVNIECVDTKPNDKTSPTIVALHGCPGSHMDFTQLIADFGTRYRVVVPNFPDFSLTDSTNTFWHSAQEKAQFVRDILKLLDIHSIDCLVTHSSAIFPASYLWLKDDQQNNDFKIKSLCLFSNPGPKWFTKKGVILSSVLVNISRVQQIRQYLRKIWTKKWTNRLGLRNQISNYDNLALLLSTYYHSDTQTVDKRLKKLAEMQIPTLSVFSTKDKLFKDDIFYSLFENLGTNYEDFDVYEEYQNLLIQKSTNMRWIKVVNITGGGHYVFSTHWPLVYNYIEELLQKIDSKDPKLLN